MCFFEPKSRGLLGTGDDKHCDMEGHCAVHVLSVVTCIPLGIEASDVRVPPR